MKMSAFPKVNINFAVVNFYILLLEALADAVCKLPLNIIAE
jgi:hypothetical protein